MSLIYSVHTSAEKTMTIAAADSPTGMSNITGERSPWHSPVPYLFGGLAAMLGLIAFALLILACSYWRLSGYLESERDIEAGDSDGGSAETDDVVKKEAPSPVFEEKFLVIMAGQQKPTCLATPMWSRASSTSKSSSCSNERNSLIGENKDINNMLENGAEMAGLTANPSHHLQEAVFNSGN